MPREIEHRRAHAQLARIDVADVVGFEHDDDALAGIGGQHVAGEERLSVEAELDLHDTDRFGLGLRDEIAAHPDHGRGIRALWGRDVEREQIPPGVDDGLRHARVERPRRERLRQMRLLAEAEYGHHRAQLDGAADRRCGHDVRDREEPAPRPAHGGRALVDLERRGRAVDRHGDFLVDVADVVEQHAGVAGLVLARLR
jgi:hypothetical protein